MADTTQSGRSEDQPRRSHSADRGQHPTNERIRLPLDAIASGVVVQNRDGTIVEANDAACMLLGLSRDQLLGNAPSDIPWRAIHEDGAPFPGDTYPAIVALRTGQTVASITMGVFTATTTPRWLQVNATPVRDPDTGRVQQVISTFVDISERKRLENDLSAALAHYHTVVKHVPIVAFTAALDPLGSILYISPQITSILGFGPADFAGDPGLWAKRLHPADRDRVLDRLAESRAHAIPFDAEYRLVARNGQIRWFHDLADIVYAADGQPKYLQGVMCDVTTRKEAQEEQARILAQLDAERAWLRTVIARSPIGIVLAEGPNGERITTNEQARDLFGRPFAPDALVRHTFGENCFHADGRPIAFHEFAIVRALRGESVSGEVAVICQPTGHQITVQVSSAPILDQSGSVLGAVAGFQDISRLKDLERLREEWTSIVVHDLRQPVSLIMAYASWLLRQIQQQAPVEETVRSAEFIGVAAQSMERMTRDLLDVSRIATRQLKLVKHQIDLPSLVRDLVARTRPITEGHAVRVDVVGAVPRVEADSIRIEQVLANLLSNAANYSDPGTGITVQVERRCHEVRVAVTNVGAGIAPEEIPKLFNQFYRTHGAWSVNREGLGLGLYICKGIIEAHGGRIDVVSAPGQTTTVTVILPCQPSRRRGKRRSTEHVENAPDE